MPRFKFLKGRRNLGLMLLAAWLILTGLGQANELRLWGIALGALAIAAGVLILLDR